MSVSYNKLLKLLIDKNMMKGELYKAASIRPSSLAKMKNSENGNTDLLVMFCRELGCEPGGVMELSPDNQQKMKVR